MMAILGFITGLAGPIRDIAAKIADLKIAQVQASTDQEKAKIQGEIEEARARQMVLSAEAGSRINSIVRGFLALGAVVYLNKILLWDKVIGSFAGYTQNVFRTDELTDQQWKYVVAVVAFYFVYDIAARFRR